MRRPHSFYVQIVFYKYFSSSLSIHPLKDIWADCIFWLLWMVHGVAMNMSVQISFWYDFISLGYIPSGRAAELYGGSFFRFLRNLHTDFHNGYTNLHSHEQCMCSLFFLMTALQTGVRWYLIVVFVLQFSGDQWNWVKNNIPNLTVTIKHHTSKKFLSITLPFRI